VLFNRPPVPWELRAPDADWGSPDQTAKLFGSELPLSKTGAPIASPYPQPSITRQQWLDIAHLVTPNIVDYFTKPVPPPPPFPSTPGKIPSDANPYAPGALFEAATLLPLLEGGLLAPLVRGAARIAEEAAPAAVARIAGAAGASRLVPVPDRAARLLRLGAEVGRAEEDAVGSSASPQPITGPYKQLSGNLPTGIQAHHLNQNAVYGIVIPRREGLSVAMKGNALTEPGTPHFETHQCMEQF
jgi:hypothetical protein